MAYQKTNWQDTIRDSKGNIIQRGTPLNAQALSKIEDGIIEVTTGLEDLKRNGAVVEEATTTRKGIVKLNDTLTSDSQNEALTAAQGKLLDSKIRANNIFAAPETYGALKNGTYNDALAFREAYDGGVRNLIPMRGKYTMHTPFIISINESLTITGESRKDTVIQNGTSQKVYDASLEFRNAKDVSVSNLTLDGNINNIAGDIWQGVVNMRLHQCERATVRDITFQNNWHAGMFVRNGRNITIENCEFNNLDTGINTEGTTDGKDMTIKNCSFDGFGESEPISMTRFKHVSITDCIMLNKIRGHAMAFEGCDDVYVNNVYANYCGNGYWTIAKSGVRCTNIKIENCDFVNMVTGSILKNTDNALIRDCYFEDGFHSIVDCNNVVFENCTFKSVNRPCMVAFHDNLSTNVRFVNCTFDNTANKNWGNAAVTFYEPKIVATDVVFEKCNFINSVLLNEDPRQGTTIKLIDCKRNGADYYVSRIGVETINSSAFKVAATTIPNSGYYKKNAAVLFANPTTHIGAINLVDGYAFDLNWSVGLVAYSGRQVRMSNGIVIRAKNSGTVGSGTAEPANINSTHTTNNPFVDASGIQWVYLGPAANFKRFGPIETT